MPELAQSEPAYVVVDEIVGDAVGLAIHPWPRADHEGRLRFRQAGDGRFCGVDRKELQAFLDKCREGEMDEALARRPVTIGDVYAATVTSTAARAKPAKLLGEPVVDVTIDAREAAKVAFYGAVAAPLKPSEVDRWIEEGTEDEDEPPTATGTPMPVPR
jgi:hypothetical protein